jgi:hypothetical protein
MIRDSVRKYSNDYWTLAEIVEYSKEGKQIGPFSVLENVIKVAKILGWRRVAWNTTWYVVPNTMDDDFNYI